MLPTRTRSAMIMIPTADPSSAVPDAERAGTAPAGMLKLIAWLSPAFPVGSFSYSHGLEFAIDSSVVKGEADLQAWIDAVIREGSGWNDCVLLAQAWRSARTENAAALTAAAELAEALAPSRERHLESILQGAAFLDAVLAGWPARVASELRISGGTPYSVAVGAVAAENAIPLGDALLAWLNAFATTLISVAVRLVPLGQSAGLRTQAALHPIMVATSLRAAESSLDDLGSATILSDIHSMRHEHQYSRVFRT